MGNTVTAKTAESLNGFKDGDNESNEPTASAKVAEEDHFQEEGISLNEDVPANAVKFANDAEQAPALTISGEIGTLRAIGISMSIPSNMDAQKHVMEQHGKGSWEHAVLEFLHSSPVQAILASLLALDVILLFTELALLSHFPSCNLVERDAVSCCPGFGEKDEHHDDDEHRILFRTLAASGGHGDDHHLECPAGLVASPQYDPTCDDHKWHRVHAAEDAFYFATMGILGLFLLENLVMIWAVRPKVYFRQAFYVLDLFIVSFSIALESAFYVLGDEKLQSIVGIVILGRLWRFVRIGHGIVEVVSEIAGEKLNHLWEYTEALEKKLAEHEIALPEGVRRPNKSAKMSHHSSSGHSDQGGNLDAH